MLMINFVRAIVIATIGMIFIGLDSHTISQEYLEDFSKGVLAVMVAFFSIEATDHYLIKWFNPSPLPEASNEVD